MPSLALEPTEPLTPPREPRRPVPAAKRVQLAPGLLSAALHQETLQCVKCPHVWVPGAERDVDMETGERFCPKCGANGPRVRKPILGDLP